MKAHKASQNNYQSSLHSFQNKIKKEIAKQMFTMIFFDDFRQNSFRDKKNFD